jgi:hypothetical protein
MAILEQKGDEPVYVGWIDKKKRGKVQKRLLIVGHHRIMTLKPGGKVTFKTTYFYARNTNHFFQKQLARDGHLLDLREIKSLQKIEVSYKIHLKDLCH